MAKRDEGKAVFDKHLKKYLDGVIALVPEDKRAEAAKQLEQDSLFDELGETAMMRSDYSKNLDALRVGTENLNKYNADLNGWYTQNQQALTDYARLKEENDALKAKGGAPVDPASDPDQTAALKKLTENFVPKSELEKIIAQRGSELANNLLGTSSAQVKMAMQHYKNFGEELDPDVVVQYAVKNKKDLPSAYSELFKDKYSEKAAAEEKKAREKLEADLRVKIEEEIRAKNPNLPYSISNSMDAGLSPILDAMKKKDGNAAAGIGVDAAVDEFYRMQRPQ